MYVYLKAVIGICNISNTEEKQKREHPGANPPTLLAFTDFDGPFLGRLVVAAWPNAVRRAMTSVPCQGQSQR